MRGVGALGPRGAPSRGEPWASRYLAPLVVPAWVFQLLDKPEDIRRRDAASFRPGDGLSVVESPNAKARFEQMVRREMKRSRAFHELMLKINEPR